jgi:ferrous iron transport protein B
MPCTAVGGPLLFVVIMALVFQSVFSWAAPVQDLFETAAVALGGWVGGFLPEGDLRSLVVDGVFAGVGGVVVFLPQIAILFAFIGLLEQTGYMARAAYLMDRVMRRVGLHGKSFIPMLSGYACAVPGHHGHAHHRRPQGPAGHHHGRAADVLLGAPAGVHAADRRLCAGAAAAGRAWTCRAATMLVMYLLGTVTALAIAFVFRRTLLKGPVRPDAAGATGLPLALAAVAGWCRCGSAARCSCSRAGTVILVTEHRALGAGHLSQGRVSMPRLPETVQQEQQLAQSVLGRFGHAIEPVVAPLGYDWKIGVSHRCQLRRARSLRVDHGHHLRRGRRGRGRAVGALSARSSGLTARRSTRRSSPSG